MACFKNITKFPLPVVINGNRRTVKPNRIVHGPDSLANIQGLQRVDNKLNVIIPKNGKSYTPKKPKKKIYSSFDSSGESNYDTIIANELNHLSLFANKTDLPSVTIAILTKDAYNLITKCCNSILDKVKYKNITIMLIDTGTTSKRVRDYYKFLEQQCKSSNIGFQLINMNYYHFGKNYNEAINNHVVTDYVLIQNNDTEAINDYVSRMMKTAVLNKVASVGCRMIYPNSNLIQHDGQIIYDRNGRLINPGHVHLKQNFRNISKKENITKKVDGNTGAGILIRTDYFKKVGGFDINYGDIFQDVDFMIKLQNKLNKHNYCNREAMIVHHDNATRFSKGMPAERLAQMHRDKHYLEKQYSKNKWFRKNPELVDFSIVTVVNNLQVYQGFLSSIRKQEGKHKIELISVPNFSHQFSSITSALNAAGDIANGKYIIYVHQDVIPEKDWLNRIRKHIVQLNAERIKWGVLGSAGVTIQGQAHYFLNDSQGKHNSSRQQRSEVFCLDELNLIVEKEKCLRFSEELDGFHFYGCDLCSNAISRGLKNFAIDAWCQHLSDSGTKHTKDDQKYVDYINQGKKIHAILKKRGLFHWRTTTAYCKGNLINFYLIPKDWNGNTYDVMIN